MANYIPSPRDWVREQVELYESSGGTEGTTLRDTGLPVIIVTHMYGPAVRCKRVSSIWRTCGLASMYPASDWSVLCSEPSWISARVRSYYRTGLEWAIWVTSVRMRR